MNVQQEAVEPKAPTPADAGSGWKPRTAVGQTSPVKAGSPAGFSTGLGPGPLPARPPNSRRREMADLFLPTRTGDPLQTSVW